MQQWLNWARKEYMFQYQLSKTELDFMGFPDNRKLCMSKLSSELRLAVTCHYVVICVVNSEGKFRSGWRD